MLPEEPELPELPERPEESDEPDDPDAPDEPLRLDCPLLLEPDMPPALLELPDEPLMPLERPWLLDGPSSPEGRLPPEDPTFRSGDEPAELPLMPPCDEEPLDALRALSCEPDDDPACPSWLPELEPPDEECRSRSEAEYPSPCDELPRSRFELPDELLLPLWPLLDEPEVFRSRSAICKPPKPVDILRSATRSLPACPLRVTAWQAHIECRCARSCALARSCPLVRRRPASRRISRIG